MFGIGKKKETDRLASDFEENESEKEINFDFEEEDHLPFDDQDGFADEEFPEEPPRSGLRQALSKRTLLLGLLLLLVLGAGGYYFLFMTSEPPPPSPAPPVKARVKVQPAPPPEAAKSVTAPSAPQNVASTPVPAAPTQPAAASAVAPVVKGPEASPQGKKAPVAAKPYTLSAGTFVSEKNLRDVEKKIRRLGYTPRLKKTSAMVPMTRLLLGVYEPSAAAARSRELSAKLPEIFSVKRGDKVALYAGSYQDLDQARRFADKLYQLGIHVDEETTSLRMSLKNISYGSFASRAAAEKAVTRAAAVGLSATVVKR